MGPSPACCRPKELNTKAADIVHRNTEGGKSDPQLYLHEFGGFAVGLSQFDASGQIDVCHFIGDTVGGVELAYIVM
jgi:hypothetical protein